MSAYLHLLPVASAVLQFLGTALVVWGLKITAGEQVEEGRADGTARPLAIVWNEHPYTFAAGVMLLLLGLALQVAVAVIVLLR